MQKICSISIYSIYWFPEWNDQRSSNSVNLPQLLVQHQKALNKEYSWNLTNQSILHLAWYSLGTYKQKQNWLKLKMLPVKYIEKFKNLLIGWVKLKAVHLQMQFSKAWLFRYLLQWKEVIEVKFFRHQLQLISVQLRYTKNITKTKLLFFSLYKRYDNNSCPADNMFC